MRQHTEHKRTFFYLEQLILKHGADAHCVNIRDIHEGVDFFFSNRHCSSLMGLCMQEGRVVLKPLNVAFGMHRV